MELQSSKICVLKEWIGAKKVGWYGKNEQLFAYIPDILNDY